MALPYHTLPVAPLPLPLANGVGKHFLPLPRSQRQNSELMDFGGKVMETDKPAAGDGVPVREWVPVLWGVL